MIIFQKFDDILNEVLTEACKHEFKAAVGIVQMRDRWLLGLSTANDDRKMKWAFPGGHIKRGETPEEAVVREVREETGIRCKVVGKLITLHDKKGVAFFHCEVTATNQKLDNNSEFATLGWFKMAELKGLKLYENVKKLLDRVR